MKMKLYKISFIMMLIVSLLMFIISLYFFMYDYSLMLEFQFYNFMTMKFSMLMLIDWMSCIFISFVLLISSMVVNYSMDYMMMDKSKDRFLILVLMFVFSMILLIISPNLMSILIGWDGLGFVSYCLVVYFQNIKSYSAGMMTILSNRIGDISLLFSIIFMMNYGSWNFMIYKMFYMDMNMFMVMIFVLIASITKSAQIPFSSWLPMAMAAPTPVSALVHSSTLVTAGVYLMIRFNYMFMNNMLMNLLLIISSLTMFMAGIGANYEYDLKKIIALSTLSQLSLMMVILSLGKYELAFFHLLVHALFKALMFLCAGVIIHNLMMIQDIRKMGSLINLMPLECSCLILSNMILCGMPFLSGFYSSDLILEMMMMMKINLLCMFLVIISTGLTVMYSVRLIYYLMIMDYQFYSFMNISKNVKNMSFSMMLMMVLSMFMGSMLMWLIFNFSDIVLLPFYLKNLVLFICLLGGFIGYLINKFNECIYKNKVMMMNNLYKIFMFNSMMWFLPHISVNLFIYKSMKMSKSYLKMIDLGWLEFYGSMGFYNNILNLVKKIQIYHINNYMIYMSMFYFWFMIIYIIFMFI
uniref:NADH dehydrogenase subunit 5 n=1 Tax=Penicillidia dufourii TaxID=1321409 RepID=UPI002551F48A|nr:NADH dehydrogenase subunit 5 [Penicillidia dufourii]WGH14995.1 NADH dehydrogenase subunit 5 [Penicillidia dufourii]